MITSNLAIHIVTIEERKKKVWGIRSRHEKEVHVNTDFLLLFYFFFYFFPIHSVCNCKIPEI